MYDTVHYLGVSKDYSLSYTFQYLQFCIDMMPMFSKLSGDSSPDVQYIWIFYMDVTIFKILYN